MTTEWTRQDSFTRSEAKAMARLRQRQPSAVAVSGFRQLAPIHDAGAEGRVTVVDLAGQRILRRNIGKHLFAERAEHPDQLVAEAEDLDPLIGAQPFECLNVLRVVL